MKPCKFAATCYRAERCLGMCERVETIERIDAREDTRRATPALKRCAACGRSLPASEFHKHKTHTDGLQSRCKECTKARRQALREERKACKATT